MSFPEKSTAKDLSSLPENQGFPAYCSSMAGTNMVTDKNEHFAGQGSDSEASHDIESSDVSYAGFSHQTPELPGTETPDSDLSTDNEGSGYSPTPRIWKDAG